MSGTIAGQALLLAALPVITRLYDPTAMGFLGVYMSATAILSVAACLRFDLATPLPDTDREAARLLLLGLGAATAFSALVAVICIGFPDWILEVTDQQAFSPYMWLIPIGMWFTAAYAAMQFWSIRRGRYGLIAKTQVARAAGGTGAQVSLGWVGMVPSGALIGHAIYTALGTGSLMLAALRNERRLFQGHRLVELRKTFASFRRFPIYSVPESLLNTLAMQAPVIIVASLSGAAEAGFLMLAMRVLSVPVGLIGRSVSRVYLADAGKKLREQQLARFTHGIMSKLFLIAVVPFSGLALTAPVILPWIFGSEWQRAGVIVTWLVPAMLLQFIVSPVSTSLHATGNQRLSLIVQVVNFMLSIGAIYAASAVAPDFVSEAFCVGLASAYGVYFIAVLFSVTGR